jgi:predicted permease
MRTAPDSGKISGVFDLLRADLRQSRRSLLRTPLVTAATVVCLASAIAASAAVFTIVDSVVLRPLPFANASRLVAIWGVNPSRDTVRRGFSWPDTQDIAHDRRSLDRVAAMSNAAGGMTLTGTGDAVQIPTRIVSGNFFEVLGVPAALGRTLTAEDDRPGSVPTVVLSDALWRQRFGADPSVVGRGLTLDGRAFTVAGVAPRTFAYPPGAQMWVTVAHGAVEVVDDRGVGWLEIIGLTKHAVTADAVRAEITPAFADLARRYHAARGPEDLSVVPLERELLGDTRTALFAVFAAVLVLLLVACANVGGLLLVRGAANARDSAVRRALGADRLHIVRQAFAESAWIAAASGALGVAASASLLGVAKGLAPADIPRLADATLDMRVLGFATLVVALASAVCTVIPALQQSFGDMQLTLQRGGRGMTGDRPTLRRALAASEIALSIALIVSAGVVGRTFMNLKSLDVGFAADHVLAFDVPQPTSRYPTAEDSVRFADRLLPRLSSLPGVRRSAAVLLRPLWGIAGMDWSVVIEGQAPADALQNPLTNLEAVSAGYFDTMSIPVLEGRAITAEDGAGRPAAAVVGASFARRFWPDGRALGRRVQFPLPGSPYHRQWFTVVGVVGDAKYRGLRGGRLDLYISAAQCPYAVHQFVVRADGNPGALTNAVRAEVRAIDPDLPIDDVVVLSDAVAQQIAGPRFTAAIFAAFAATATGLAALGLGTLIAWQVRRRTREIGIRLALGASSSQVIRLVMAEGAVIVAAGVGAGLVTAGLATTFLESLLFEVAPRDPTSLGAAAAVSLAVGVLSAYVPARRSSRIDPLIALRQED